MICILASAILVCTSENTYHSSTSSFTIKPRVAYYVPLVLEKFFWAPACEFGFNSNSSKEEVDKGTIKTEKQPFNFTTGLNILSFEMRPWKHLAFDFSFGGLYYNVSTVTTSTEVASVTERTNNLTFGFNDVFSPTLGVKYIF